VRLFCPQSLISEGRSNYGINVFVSGKARIQFEEIVLVPVTGIDPANAAKYYTIQNFRGQLSYADNEAAREYLQGETSRE
jgi:hypothetical protein